MVDTELVTTLKRNATKLIAKVRRKRTPMLITERGLPAAYLIDVKSYEAMQTRMTILEGLARGEKDIREGRVLTQKQAEKKLARMAQVIWSFSAETKLESIADYIALENPKAARLFVQRVVTSTRQLKRFPQSGSRILELPGSASRQLIVRPCLLFYRCDKDRVVIQFVIRSERLFHAEFLG